MSLVVDFLSTKPCPVGGTWAFLGLASFSVIIAIGTPSLLTNQLLWFQTHTVIGPWSIPVPAFQIYYSSTKVRGRTPYFRLLWSMKLPRLPSRGNLWYRSCRANPSISHGQWRSSSSPLGSDTLSQWFCPPNHEWYHFPPPTWTICKTSYRFSDPAKPYTGINRFKHDRKGLWPLTPDARHNARGTSKKPLYWPDSSTAFNFQVYDADFLTSRNDLGLSTNIPTFSAFQTAWINEVNARCSWARTRRQI